VRTKRNIERVRRDEEIAKQNELSKEKRILLAEQERRTQLLRDKAQTSSSVTTTVVEGSLPSKHINIFDDFKDKIKTENIEHQKEVKEEKEKWEKANGLLNYLHNKDIDSDNNWYLDSHEVRMKLIDDKNDNKINCDFNKNLKDIKVKKFNDPLEDMKRYLDVMKHKTNDNLNKSVKKSIEFVKSNDSKKTKKSVKHKHKKKKRKRRHSSSSSEDSDKTSNKSVSKSLEQLRAERLKREKVERERTRLLLSNKMKTNEELVIMDDRQRTYNSQFNPQIARQNFDK
jgi:hypothetical protein